MLKAVGIVIVLGVCGYLGIMQKNSLKQRIKDLQSMIFAVRNIETELSYGRETINLVLNKTAAAVGGTVADFLRSVARDLNMSAGKLFKEVWQENLAVFADRLSFNAEAVSVLNEFACGFGVSHTEDQLKKLRLTVQKLERCLTLASEDYQRLGKVFQAFGWCFGMVLVLLLA